MSVPAGAAARVRREDLPAVWVRLMRAVGARDDVTGAGARLVAAYALPARHHHDLDHLCEVLGHVADLADVAVDLDAVRLAAWYHDAVLEPGSVDDEERSAGLAARELGRLRLAPALVAEVVRLVRLTADHDPAPHDRDGAVLCDADLAVLAREPQGYARYVAGVRAERPDLDDEEFRAQRAAVLRGLLARPVLFRTAPAAARWEARARANLAAELAALDPPP